MKTTLSFINRLRPGNIHQRQAPTRFVCTIYFGLMLAGMPLLHIGLDAVAVQAQAAAPAEVRRGYTLLEQGLVNDAITTFRSAISRYPRSLEAKLGVAIAYRRAGRDTDAWQAYQQVLAQDPNNQLALRTIGILGAYRPEWQSGGIAALTTLLSQNAGDIDALSQRALLYSYQGRFAESLADYQIVLQRNPSPDVMLDAAQVYTYSRNYRQALELFNRYQATGKPVTGAAAIAYAQVLRETGNPNQAVQLLQSQLPRQLNATAIQIRSELSQAYLANGQPTEALAVLDPLRGRTDSRLPLARALNELGRKQNLPTLSAEAATLYRQVLTQSNNPNAGLVREAADVLSGIPQEQPYALQLYRWLVQQQPNDKPLIIQQLALESRLGGISQVDLRQRLLSILQPLPSDSVQQLAIAQALVRVEPDPELLPVYQALIQAGVNEPFLNFRLAQVLVERNDFAGAQTALAAYRSTPTGARDGAPELLLAEIDRRLGNLEASAQRYQAVAARNLPDGDVTMAALRGLAGIRLTQGRPAEALALYEQLLARNPQDLKLQLGWASIAYQAQRISLPQAEAVLYSWLQTRPLTDTPPELYSLVSTLPASPQREPLYAALIQADPSNIPVQVRLVQVVASRDPLQAQAQVHRLLARMRETAPNNRNNAGLYFLQGQLAQAIGNPNQAAEAYKAILAFQPDNADALAALGGIRFQQRQFDSATQLYTQALGLDPNNLTLRRSLADLTAAQGNTLQAMQQLEQIQVQQSATGVPNTEVSRRMQQLQEDFLKQRGFQPPWERY